MIPRECKRLAEVDFPIANVSRSSLQENSIRRNHPKGLHLWWARRPLAACRSILLALILPDPADANCPRGVRDGVRHALLQLPDRPRRWDSESESPEGLRQVALEFISRFSHAENAEQKNYLQVARELVNAANPGEKPVVYDSFAGGGSIPLEAMRLGCDAIGSDLNPIACLILRTELELLPRRGRELICELEEAGKVIGGRFRSEMRCCFLEEGDNTTPVAYFWARQATCEAPHCGLTFPLVGSFWLCKKPGYESALRLTVAGQDLSVDCDVFHPLVSSEVPPATVKNGRGICPRCGTVLSPERLRAQLSLHHGGIEDAKLLAVVTQDLVTEARGYRKATKEDLQAAEEAALRLRTIRSSWRDVSMSAVPDEQIPRTELRRVSAPLYGCTQWEDLFLPRQRLALCTLVAEISRYVEETGREDLLPLLALAFGKVARHWNSNARWHTKGENVAGAFGRQAIPMAHFFPEQSPLLSAGAGSWLDAVSSVGRAAQAVLGLDNAGQSFRADACNTPLPSEGVDVWFTDPPYYDSVAYAHLADFFYVWVRRLLPGDPLFSSCVIEKTQECVVDRPHRQSPSQKGPAWFEHKMQAAMAEARRCLKSEAVGAVVFAHSTTEGWEALVTALLEAKWVITASWPIATERGSRLNARENASLATSVHLICRPRPSDAPVGDWADVLRELPRRVGDWMERLQGEGVRGADLVFACIGPALEIFSRYSRVEAADGREIPLAEYLEKVWEVVGRLALEQILGTPEAKARNGMVGALEEDARLTALFLWTLQSTNGGNGKNNTASAQKNSEEADLEAPDDEEEAGVTRSRGLQLIYDMVIRFTRPLGIDLEKWDGRIVEIEKGVVRLLPVAERAKQLFGEDFAGAALKIERGPIGVEQLSLFPDASEVGPSTSIRTRSQRKRRGTATGETPGPAGPTTLDRVHAAMLLQASGQANALRALIRDEQSRGSDFLRLANALSALYPRESEEKRLLDAMLLAVPR